MQEVITQKVYSTVHDENAIKNTGNLPNSRLWKGNVFTEEEYKELSMDTVNTLTEYTVKFKGTYAQQCTKIKVIKNHLNAKSKKRKNKK